MMMLSGVSNKAFLAKVCSYVNKTQNRSGSMTPAESKDRSTRKEFTERRVENGSTKWISIEVGFQ